MDPEFREHRLPFVIDDNGKERLSIEGKLLGNSRGIGSLGFVGVRQGIVKTDPLKYAEGRLADGRCRATTAGSPTTVRRSARSPRSGAPSGTVSARASRGRAPLRDGRGRRGGAPRGDGTSSPAPRGRGGARRSRRPGPAPA